MAQTPFEMESAHDGQFAVPGQRASAEGWELGLISPGRQALTVFRVSGVEENLPFIEDASAA